MSALTTTSRTGARVLAVWCPDWPVTAALAARSGGGARQPAAVFAANVVQACNELARGHGVSRGMRRRDAQARCPELLVLDANPERDARAFEDVLGVLEELRPGVAPLRPGLAALRSPGRFYGGDAAAGAVLAEAIVAVGVRDVRVGIADELFTAEQAARRAAPQESYVVGPGESAAFLRTLPVDVLDETAEPGTADLLRRLGLHTLGDLAMLPARDVAARFGPQTAWVHRVVHGTGARPLPTRTPPPELTSETDFEPPLDSSEAVCFSARQTAERFVSHLGQRQLVCTEVTIEVWADGPEGLGVASSRRWLHPRWFTAADLIDRLHWQLQGGVRGGVGRVRFIPDEVVAESVHADGLWGGTDARVERGVARVQGMLGHDAVVAPVLQGGRAPAERQAFVPWGERPAGLRDATLPWPGSIPAPAPSRVLREPWPAVVADEAGRPVRLDARGVVSGEPARLRTGVRGEIAVPVSAWAGPWPVDELWWEAAADSTPAGRRIARFQMVAVDGRAWLVTFDSDARDGHWYTEAVYD